MNKGKSIMSALTSRPRRSAIKVSHNYEEAEAWEDEMLYRSESLDVHCTKWQYPNVLEHWELEDDFEFFCRKTGLLEFSRHESTTYDESSREFLSTFKFDYKKFKKGKRDKEDKKTFDVKFRMKGLRLIMYLENFCNALHLPNTGSWEEIPTESDNELKEFWKSVSVDVPEEIHRGKLTHIQHPGLRYFALFLARGFLARNNSTACTGPILYLLKCVSVQW